jgi:GNAT superfamily N-acetyltransferase
MIFLQRTNSDNENFQALVRLLDAELAIRDGAEHAFFAQFNKLDAIKHVVLAFQDGHAVSCGAIKEYDEDTMEVKRMFTLLEHRGKGIAAELLRELEVWAVELGFKQTILETGFKQLEAIRLYEKSGYTRIPNYGQYIGVENSLCMKKNLA